MAKSAAAKELEAKQKAELKALKEKKKNSDNPADWGQWKQIKETFRATAEMDPSIKPAMALALGGPLLLAIVVALLLVFVWHLHWTWALIAIMFGVLLATFLGGRVLVQKAKAASFKRYAGQAGSGEVALGMLDPKKWTSSPAIAFTKQMDVIHRAIGPGGVLLIGEGDPNRVRALLAKEAKSHKRALYDIEPQTILMGDGEGMVPLDQLTKHITKMPKTLTTEQIAEAEKRLRALDAMRPKMPIPKGPMPTRMGSRVAMRGR